MKCKRCGTELKSKTTKAHQVMRKALKEKLGLITDGKIWKCPKCYPK